RIVTQGPIVRFAVGEDMESARGRRVARPLVAEPIERVEAEALAARAFHRDAKEIPRQANRLRRVDGDAVLGMEEAEQGRAVGDAAAQADLARCLQWLGQG